MLLLYCQLVGCINYSHSYSYIILCSYISLTAPCSQPTALCSLHSTTHALPFPETPGGSHLIRGGCRGYMIGNRRVNCTQHRVTTVAVAACRRTVGSSTPKSIAQLLPSGLSALASTPWMHSACKARSSCLASFVLRGIAGPLRLRTDDLTISKNTVGQSHQELYI